ncbi:MAG: PEP-CTERM sorting domain-containing protein [Gammaproteobacteria bacterium]|nr:MAG: PEP-CTERM sorting domain-containing protein [Gammaproteobacteria bacterium]
MKALTHILGLTAALASSTALAAPVYLNESNITVSVGAGTSPGTFNNTFANGQTINKVIDAPSADAVEYHNQTTHIWYTADDIGGGLELLFDFGTEYDITMLHFWNYTGESYDVDNIAFSFFDSSNTLVGSLSVNPALGSNGGILAEDIVLAAPLNVQFVTAFLTGDNGEVDFQNMGFTADLSTNTSVPEPMSIGLLLIGLMGLLVTPRQRS